jgi:hypothetical protein
MTNLPLGYNINIKTLDEQYGIPSEQRPDRKDDIIAVTSLDQPTAEAKAAVQDKNSNAIYEAFIKGYATGMSAEELQAAAQNIGIKQNDFGSNPDFYIEQALTVTNSDYSAVDSRIATNYQIANEIVADRMQEIGENKGSFGRAVDVADRFLRAVTPIGTYEDITAKTEARGMEILDKASTMSPADFRVWFETYADSVAQEGIFRENTLGAFQDVQAQISGAGYDPNKTFNQLMGAFDIVTSGTAGVLVQSGRKAIVKSSLKSSTTVGRVAAIEGSEAGAKAADEILKVAPDPETLGNVGPASLDLHPQPVKSLSSPFTRKFEDNVIAQQIDDMYKKGAFGRLATTEDIKAVADDIVEKNAKKVSNPVFDSKLDYEALGSYIAKVRFGRAMDGAPFKPLADGNPPESLKRYVEEIKTKVERAEIVPVDADDLRKGYVVEVGERINLSGMPEAIDEALGIEPTFVRETVGKIMNNSIAGSAAMRDNQRLSTLAQMAESSRAAVKAVSEEYTDKISRLGAKERYTVQAVYSQLRDGIDASLRVRYTEGEFYSKYKQLHPNGEAPSQKTFEAYEALAQVEEADYLLKTHAMLNRYLEKGYQDTIKVADNYYAPAKKVGRSTLPEDVRILDANTGAKLRIQDIESEEFPIWKLDRPTADGTEYVVDPTEVRLIDPTDVMGYNPGGSRLNPSANYFVVIGDKRIKAMLTTFSEKQAKLASEQLRRIQRAIANGEDNLDEIVQANNDWNPSVQTAADFRKVADEEGWDFTRGEISYKNRDGDLLEKDVDASDIFSGMKIDDYVQNDMRRNDKVLMDFGGGRAYNDDPVNSILAQFGDSVFTYTNRAYARNAMVGWVKKAQQRGRDWFPAGISSNDYEALFRSANITGNDEFARRMTELRSITLRRMSVQDDYAVRMEQYGQQFAEFVFNKTGLELGGVGPVNAMLKIGFQSAFGFMNVSQFFMQSFHAFTVMAISPIHGMKGAALTVPLRAALRGSAMGYSDEVVKRWAKAAEVSEKEAGEWLEFIRTSGRAVVDGDAIEDGTGVGFGISGWRGQDMRYTTLSGAAYNVSSLVGKGLDIGLMPFKQGERLARMTAMNTAILEFKTKFPKASLLSDQARNWITRREQDLTFNMSSLSRGAIQTGPAGILKVPTQWLAYTMRAMEAVVVGRNFTAGERARLFGALVPMFGLTGFGLTNAADYVGEKLGLEPGGALYTTLKYGLIDGMISALPMEAQIGVGTRLAPIGALLDTYKNLSEGKFLEVVGGPSGQITAGLWDAFANTASSLFYGHSTTLTEDAIQVLRTPSGIDNIAKAIGIFNNGIYRSKTGTMLDYEMSIGDGITALLGFTPLEVVENYARLDKVFSSDKKFSTFRKEVNKEAEFIFTLMEGDANDVDKAISLMQELHERISFSGFSQSQMQSLRRSARSRMETNWQKIQDNLITQDKMYALQAARNILKGSE